MGTAVPALIDHDGLFAGVRDLSAFGGETRTGYSLARHHSTSYLALVISLLSILLAKKEYPMGICVAWYEVSMHMGPYLIDLKITWQRTIRHS